MNCADFDAGDPFEQAAMNLERQQWERDQAAIAEYESWFIQKTLAEQDAEFLAGK